MSKKRERHYVGEVNERFVYIHDGKGGIERRKRCKRVARCHKWEGHEGCHVC